jgi:hypothetical protein
MARARRTDPSTSHEAAREAEASGRAASQRYTCLQEAKKTPGQTAAEIAVSTGLERHVPSRRLPELREALLVTNGEVRPCRETGRNSLTWNATVNGDPKQSEVPVSTLADGRGPSRFRSKGAVQDLLGSAEDEVSFPCTDSKAIQVERDSFCNVPWNTQGPP